MRSRAPHTKTVTNSIVIPVTSSRHRYDVLVGRGNLPTVGSELRTRLPTLGKRCGIVTDTQVGPIFGPLLMAALRSAGYDPVLLEVPAGEASKSLSAAERVCEQLVAHQLDRRSFLVALGGGVIGDLAGFVAAIYHRGIPYVQVPTTIVSQVDSSIGGKTGVNAAGGKNLLGAFHPPALVVADVAALDSLPERQFREGFAEIIKHGVIADRAMLESLPAFGRRQEIEPLIRRNIEIKVGIVTADEFETTGGRATLNFGHTVGHAIEAAAGYGRFNHGEAVAIGLAVALHLSVAKAGLTDEERGLALSCLNHFQLPVKVPGDLTTEVLLAAMRRDKKFEAGAIRFILSRQLGSAFVAEDVTEADIAGAIDAVR
ncbi:hypothetical protein AYO41_05280 [Verrucomicrobia bacterium SCGC AG-212-E04]|nr:hypothetical protein AYO41_05280 [Verrucomicrobia bacterium SCGC AG-212-E04]